MAKRYTVCERSTEIKISGDIREYTEKQILDKIRAELDGRGDCTPNKETTFDTMEEAMGYYEECRTHLGYRENHYTFHTVDIDELYISIDEWEDDEVVDYYGEDKYTICPELKDKHISVSCHQADMVIFIDDCDGCLVNTMTVTSDECNDFTYEENMDGLIDRFREETGILNLDEDLRHDTSIGIALDAWSKKEDEE